MIPRNLLPEDLYASAFIAGGYAACPTLAQDIDVWVSVQKGDIDRTRDILLKHLKENEFNYVEQDIEPKATTLDLTDRYLINLEVRRVALITDYYIPIHLMVVTGTPDMVIEQFDISTHMAALTPTGVITGCRWTPPWEPPIAYLVTPNTPARLNKLRARYHIGVK